ncbi:acid phosphatase [Brevundimonas vancanneytii]|uniref:Acid phosphatase n=1 Tax=Brevundimonas vancanneytii TaxID=1325724 RepID=A0A4P1K991_9CAUL|nr:phosphatase PAP2 family protein [Brevundimonas vancanneytii]VTO16950.1 Major phosphate-irrepressible acid phosphatase precursor [Brevundimonas vancanneytii]
MRLLIVGTAALSLALSACASGPEASLWQGYADHPQGYLGADSRFEALAFLPPPPEVDSLRAQNDLAVYRATRALKGKPRWLQAAADAEIVTPSAPGVFSEALGAPFEPERTPTLALLLGRMHADLETIQASAKASHARPRPFVSEPADICVDAAPWLGESGSYPSGHAAMGWAWALVLSELAPDRAEAILTRGLAYGDSRVICGVHYVSDVEAGRLMGAALIARLKAEPAFQRDLERARAEWRRSFSRQR